MGSLSGQLFLRGLPSRRCFIRFEQGSFCSSCCLPCSCNSLFNHQSHFCLCHLWIGIHNIYFISLYTLSFTLRYWSFYFIRYKLWAALNYILYPDFGVRDFSSLVGFSHLFGNIFLGSFLVTFAFFVQFADPSVTLRLDVSQIVPRLWEIEGMCCTSSSFMIIWPVAKPESRFNASVLGVI